MCSSSVGLAFDLLTEKIDLTNNSSSSNGSTIKSLISISISRDMRSSVDTIAKVEILFDLHWSSTLETCGLFRRAK